MPSAAKNTLSNVSTDDPPRRQGDRAPESDGLLALRYLQAELPSHMARLRGIRVRRSGCCEPSAPVPTVNHIRLVVD